MTNNRILTAATIKAQWREWNIDPTISSNVRKENKISSLYRFATDLAKNDQELAQMIKAVTEDFFDRDLDKERDGVENLLKSYRTYAPEISEALTPLAAEVNNTWRSS